MTKKDILDYFKDINQAYNDCSRYDSLERMLDELQTAQPERKKGKWIRTGEDGYCSNCKCDMPMFRNDWEWEYSETDFCPNCGADMRGDNDGSN